MTEAIEIINRVFCYDTSGVFITEEKEGIVDCLMRNDKYKMIVEEIEEELDYLSADARYKSAKLMVDKIKRKYFPESEGGFTKRNKGASLKSHQETGTVMSKSRLEQIKESGELEEKKNKNRKEGNQ